ncbi:heavy metal-associated isoprenylated plant protein 12-like [Solanum dulcamara]|uniref:heavy metal-associated isoprenylated plant protein 12-like n=1 Tax=Solanum dulcamara TaxID=45834 RepID=UPI002485100D|nr:heavy metal-associated isoprenylated plant protein 12-like [Solanum dulcamara]
MKVVLKLEYLDERVKQKVMKKVSVVEGVDSISMDTKDKKLTVTGSVDPVELVKKLKKLCHTEIVSVGPAKEAEKKKDEPKKEEAKETAEKKKEALAAIKAYPAPVYYQYLQPNQHYPTPVPARYHHYYSVEEDPNSCVIC